MGWRSAYFSGRYAEARRGLERLAGSGVELQRRKAGVVLASLDKPSPEHSLYCACVAALAENEKNAVAFSLLEDIAMHSSRIKTARPLMEHLRGRGGGALLTPEAVEADAQSLSEEEREELIQGLFVLFAPDVNARNATLRAGFKVLKNKDMLKGLLVEASSAISELIEEAYKKSEYERMFQLCFALLTLIEGLPEIEVVKEIRAAALNNMGIVFQIKGELDRAIKMHRKAYELHKSIGNVKGKANALNNLGVVYRIKGELDKAIEMHRKAYELDKSMDNKEGMAADLGNMGIVYSIKGELDKALEKYEEAYKLDKSMDNKEGMANALNNLGVTLKEKAELVKDTSARAGLLEEALACFHEAIECAEALAGSLRVAEERGGIYEQYVNPFVQAVLCCLELSVLYRDIPGKNEYYQLLAIEYAERGRVKVLRDMLEQKAFLTGNAELRQRLRNVVTELERSGTAGAELTRVAPTEIEGGRGAEVLHERSRRLAERVIVKSKPLTLEEIKRLTSGRHVLYYFLARDELAVIEIKDSRIRVHRHRDVEELLEVLNRAVEKLNQGLFRATQLEVEWKPLKAEMPMHEIFRNLADWVLSWTKKIGEEIEKHKKKYDEVPLHLTSIYRILGVLGAEFSTVIGAGGGRYATLLSLLVVLYRFALLPDALFAGREVRKYLEWKLYSLLFFEEKDDYRVSYRIEPEGEVYIIPHGILTWLPFHALKKRKENRYLVEKAVIKYALSLRWLGDGKSQAPERYLGVSAGLKGHPLDISFYTSGEIRDGGKLFSEKKLLSFDKSRGMEHATKEKLRRELEKGYDLIHIAAHGKFNHELPGLSLIPLKVRREKKDGKISDIVEEGITAREVASSVTLRSEPLVLLNLCESGMHGISPKVEGFSLASAFIIAGARAVLSTHMEVPSDKAKRLGVRVVKKVKEGKSLATALAEVQREFIKEGTPYNWVGFYCIEA